MNTVLNIFVLLPILINFFESSAINLLSKLIKSFLGTISSTEAVVSSQLVLIKAVPLPEAFLNVLWSIAYPFTVMSTIQQVIMSTVLAFVSVSSLITVILLNKAEENEDQTPEDVHMESILPKVVPTAFKPSELVESTSVHDVSITLNSSSAISASKAMSYVDAVWYGSLKPIGYGIFLRDLFLEPECIPTPTVPQAPFLKFSYADAVGYEKIEAKPARSTEPVSYDIYLGDLSMNRSPKLNPV